MTSFAEWLGLPKAPAIGVRALRVVEEAAWRSVEAALRWPLWTLGGAAVAVATPYVSLIGLGIGAGITLSSVGILAFWGGSARRERAESLPEIARARHRQRRFRARWPEAMEAAKLARPRRTPARQTLRERLRRLPPSTTVHPKLLRVRMVSADHLRAEVDTRPTATPPPELAKAQARILAATGARLLRVTTLKPDRAQIDVRWRDPLDVEIRPSHLPRPLGGVRAVIGLDENGDPVVVDCRLPQLIVGASGAGKSSQLWMTLEGLRRAGVPVRLRVYDPKGGTEFGELEKVAYHYAQTPGSWPDLIKRTRSAMEARQASMRKRGLRKLERFTDAEPLDITIIDEYLMVKNQLGDKKAAADTEQVLSQGRAAGYIVIALTQNGTKEVIGQMAELFPVRVCMRVVTDSMVPVAINAPASAFPAHEISRAGEGYINQDGRIVRYRAAHMGRNDIQRVVSWLRRTRRGAEE